VVVLLVGSVTWRSVLFVIERTANPRSASSEMGCIGK
jgi:hypothetical protein